MTSGLPMLVTFSATGRGSLYASSNAADPTKVASIGKADDRIVKSSFFHRIHLTGLWAEARYPATPAYGIVGMQVGVFETGRFTLPAVGVMLVVTADGQGGHAWQPATTFGFGYRIGDFVPPLIGRQVSVHINVATVHVHGGRAQEAVPGVGSVNLFGLSVSARRTADRTGHLSCRPTHEAQQAGPVHASWSVIGQKRILAPS